MYSSEEMKTGLGANMFPSVEKDTILGKIKNKGIKAVLHAGNPRESQRMREGEGGDLFVSELPTFSSAS